MPFVTLFDDVVSIEQEHRERICQLTVLLGAVILAALVIDVGGVSGIGFAGHIHPARATVLGNKDLGDIALRSWCGIAARPILQNSRCTTGILYALWCSRFWPDTAHSSGFLWLRRSSDQSLYRPADS